MSNSGERSVNIIHTINIIAAIVRAIHMKRVLHSIDENPALNFWRVIHGNLLDMAVLEWCKLFGSDHEDRQPSHWKNIVPEEDHEKFRTELYNHLGIDRKAWLEYWKEIKTYRDKAVAHFDIKSRDITHYPVLDGVLEATYYYYEYLIVELREATDRYPDDIREYCSKFTDQTTEIAKCALSATSTIEEAVY